LFFREKFDRREIEYRSKGVITAPAVQQDIAAGSPPRAMVAWGQDEPPTAALGAGRIHELKAQLHKAKVSSNCFNLSVQWHS